jgi:hypothetical protein
MRFLHHQALLVWLLVLAIGGGVAIVGAQGPQTVLQPATATSTRAAIDDVRRIIAHLPSMHVALELGQGTAWAQDVADQARTTQERHRALGAEAEWDAVVAAAEALAAADPVEERADYLALASQLNQRVFALAAAL